VTEEQQAQRQKLMLLTTKLDGLIRVTELRVAQIQASLDFYRAKRDEAIEVLARISAQEGCQA
jgi:hypothetical protein